MSANAKPGPAQCRTRTAACAVSAGLLVILLAGCRPDIETTRVAGWSLVDPSQRHPIMVSQQPTTISVRVEARGGLSYRERARVIGFLEHYRSTEMGNNRLVVEVPGGSANEVAAMQATADIRRLMDEIGFDPSSITVEPYPAARRRSAPIRITFLRYVAEGPECGTWPTNLARSEKNLHYPNFGCAQQANLAAMVANPADLLGPRTRTPPSAERGDVVWEKYVKGESTISNKKGDESVQAK
ncbi:MAG: CpaD family pilus assembly protein [Hyphomicrobiaceae bacterium]